MRVLDKQEAKANSIHTTPLRAVRVAANHPSILPAKGREVPVAVATGRAVVGRVIMGGLTSPLIMPTSMFVLLVARNPAKQQRTQCARLAAVAEPPCESVARLARPGVESRVRHLQAAATTVDPALLVDP